MAFKIFIGRADKGGPSAQQAQVAEAAASDLELQLNDKTNNVQSIQGFFLHDTNPLQVEIIAVAVVSDSASKKKGE